MRKVISNPEINEEVHPCLHIWDNMTRLNIRVHKMHNFSNYLTRLIKPLNRYSRFRILINLYSWTPECYRSKFGSICSHECLGPDTLPVLAVPQDILQTKRTLTNPIHPLIERIEIHPSHPSSVTRANTNSGNFFSKIFQSSPQKYFKPSIVSSHRSRLFMD